MFWLSRVVLYGLWVHCAKPMPTCIFLVVLCCVIYHFYIYSLNSFEFGVLLFMLIIHRMPLIYHYIPAWLDSQCLYSACYRLSIYLFDLQVNYSWSIHLMICLVSTTHIILSSWECWLTWIQLLYSTSLSYTDSSSTLLTAVILH